VHIDVADEHARVVLAELDGDVKAILVECARDVELIATRGAWIHGVHLIAR